MLNMKKIKLIGFDMDYTLVRYRIEAFESLAHSAAAAYMVNELGYPLEIGRLVFDGSRAIVGLVIDKRNGNLLKLNRYGKVKLAFHGLAQIDFRSVNNIYRNTAVDVRESDFVSLDTSFAISTGVLFSQIIDLAAHGLVLPGYARIANDVIDAIDAVHKNGAIKSVILKDFPTYVESDPKVALMLERYKDYGKKLMIITNSDYGYTRALLEYALDPYWQNHTSWRDVFDVVITLADKPRFFERSSRFLSIDPETGLMQNHEGPVSTGLYQGGWFGNLQRDFGFDGSEILYIGDHIYGDVVAIKKRCDWRTALVLGDLEGEIQGISASRDLQLRIESLMAEKAGHELEINRLDLERYERKSGGAKPDVNTPDKTALRARLDELFDRTDVINSEISDCLSRYRDFFNPYWGEILRAGQEESRYAEQIDRYACIYMERVSDLYQYSPKTYFRPVRRVLPHEL